ncbi:hypothetical protein KY328_01595 [Candidatus Woesearchaeota archaeon]|nr:hypothetical protein [Candidatus Woesearchaeota archaeon]
MLQIDASESGCIELGPFGNYEVAVRIAKDVVRKIAENVAYGSMMLDFGAGRGRSVDRLADVIDRHKFHHVIMYDKVDRGLDELMNRDFRRDYSLCFTTEKPVYPFDFVNMWFVASNDLEAVTEAAELTKRYLLVFDYDMKGLPEEKLRMLCCTDVERRLIRRGGFFKRVRSVGIYDYIAKMMKAGLDIAYWNRVGRKFCVVVGERDSRVH